MKQKEITKIFKMVSKCLKGIALKFKGIALKFSNCFKEISLGERLCLLGHLRWDRHCGSNKALFNYQVGMKSLRPYKSGSRRQLIRPTPAQCRINVSNAGPMFPCVRCLQVLLYFVAMDNGRVSKQHARRWIQRDERCPTKLDPGLYLSAKPKRQ